MAHIKSLSEEQISKINSAFSNNLPNVFSPFVWARNHLITMLMLDAGLRVGEVVGLHWADLLYEGESSFRIVVPAKIAKNKISRTIPTSEKLKDSITVWFHLSCSADGYQPTKLVFGSKITNMPITTRQVRRIIGVISRSALGFPINPHVLRHSFATRLMRRTSSRVVQELLGHKQLSSTQVYTHPNSDDLTQAIHSMSKKA